MTPISVKFKFLKHAYSFLYHVPSYARLNSAENKQCVKNFTNLAHFKG